MKARKIAGLLLALALVLAVPATAFAAGTGTVNSGKITIDNTVNDTNYSIYRIFDLESFSDATPDDHTDGAYAYKVNASWAAFFADGAEGRNYIDLDETGYVNWKADADPADFASKALAYAQADDTKIAATASKTATANNTPLTFENLPLGYYLVDSTLGSLCALTTTNTQATVIEKNAVPVLDKKVKEGSEWLGQNDAGLGDTVVFCATITVQGYAKGYVMHDQMDDGLSFGSVSKITLNGDADANIVPADGNYSVDTAPADMHSFDITFTDAFCESLKSGDKIAIYYTATLNENAIVKEPENNNAHLEYREYSGLIHNTTDSNTKTYTWEIPVLKYENGDTNTPLADAKFILYKTETTGQDGKKTYSDPVQFNIGAAANTYVAAAGGTVTEITTDQTGRFKLDGLDAGTYYLKETEAPAGFNRLGTAVTVIIDHNGQIDAGEKNDDNTVKYAPEVQVQNKSGAELPSTGGSGTATYYVLGSILTLVALVLLVAKKRMNREK